MIRKVWLGMSVLAILAPGVANALGVGNYRLNSYLDQPLSMDIPLTGTQDLAAGDIIVSLADQKTFDEAGIKRTAVLSSLNFSVTVNKEGGGDVHITTQGSVSMPYLDFLVQVLWPTGRIVREYTLLLDPASYAQAVAPIAVVSPTTASPTVIHSVGASHNSDQPVVGSNTAPLSAAPAGTARTYTVQKGDSLWSIASRMRRDNSISIQQMVIAIEQANPDAFTVSGNANSVRSGALLHIPDASKVAGLKDAVARRRLAQQNRRWQKLRAQQPPAGEQINAGSQQIVRTDDVKGGVRGQVQLLTASTDSDVAQTTAGGTAGDAASTQADADQTSSLLSERLDLLAQKNQELSSRLDDLTQQVATSDKLLELRSARIALMQKELRKLKEQGADVSPALLKSISAVADDTAAVTPNGSGKVAAAKITTASSAAPAEKEVASAAPASKEGVAVASAVKTQNAASQAPATVNQQVAGGTAASKTAAAAAVTAPAKPTAAPESTAGTPSDEQPMGAQSTTNASASNTPVSDSAKSTDKVEPVTTPAEPQAQTQTQAQPQAQAGIVARALEFVRQNLLVAGIAVVLLLLIVLALVKRSRAGAEEVNFDEADLTPEGQAGLAVVTPEAASQPAEVPAQESAKMVDSALESEAIASVAAAEPATTANGLAGVAVDNVHDNDIDDVTMENWGDLQADDDLLPDGGDLDFSFDDTDLTLDDTPASNGRVGFETLDVDARKPLELGTQSDLLEFDSQPVTEATIPSAQDASKEGGDESDLAFDFEEFGLDETTDTTVDSNADTVAVDAADAAVAAIDVDADAEFSFDDWQLDSSAADGIETAADLDVVSAPGTSLDGAALSAATANVAVMAEKASDTATAQASSMDNIEGLGWDDADDFSLLDGGDENATRLDLARAYIDMGDKEGACDLLAEVVQDGDEQQKNEAQELLNQVG